ncbi:MAG: PQQ-binding-like beta-propeller repeat protein [Acidobacteriota bacterium]
MSKRSFLRVTPVVLLVLIGGSLVQNKWLAASANGQIALSEPLTVRWRYDSDSTLNLTPAYDQERIYLPLAGGTLVALRAKDGQLYWRSEIGGELSASPAADDRAVYVASETASDPVKIGNGIRRATGTLRALGREGGVTQWMRTLAMPIRGGLLVSGNKLIAAGWDGRVYAFDRGTGAIVWSMLYVARFNCQPVVSEGRVYVGSEDGNLLAVAEDTGNLLWRYRSKGPVRGPVATANGTVFFGSGDGYVYAVSASSGDLLWRKRTGAGVEAVALANDTLLVASLDNFVYGFSLNGGKLWKRQLQGRLSAQPLTASDGALFTPLSSPAGIVLGLPDGKQINSLPTGEEIATSASPIAVGDAVLLTTGHGLLAFTRPKENATAVGH